jgi:hypothetical protein
MPRTGRSRRRPMRRRANETGAQKWGVRNYPHRLMDYNNDSTTHLNDLQGLFTETMARMR